MIRSQVGYDTYLRVVPWGGTEYSTPWNNPQHRVFHFVPWVGARAKTRSCPPDDGSKWPFSPDNRLERRYFCVFSSVNCVKIL